MIVCGYVVGICVFENIVPTSLLVQNQLYINIRREREREKNRWTTVLYTDCFSSFIIICTKNVQFHTI